MSRLARALHLDDGEFDALRAQIEAKPLPAGPAPRPRGWGRAALNHLLAEAPVERFRHGRYSVAALVPPGQLAVVPLPDPAEAVIADVRAAMAQPTTRDAKGAVAL